MSFIAQEQRQDCKKASANACLKINQWKVSNFKHKKSICRGLSLLHDRISDHWGDTSKFSSQTARGLILPMKQRQLFDSDPWPAATLNPWSWQRLTLEWIIPGAGAVAGMLSWAAWPWVQGCRGTGRPTVLLPPLLETIQQWQERPELAEQ